VRNVEVIGYPHIREAFRERQADQLVKPFFQSQRSVFRPIPGMWTKLLRNNSSLL